LSGVLTGPLGNNVPFARFYTISDTTWGFGDLAPFGRLQIKATPSPSFYSGTNTQTAEAYRKTLVKQ
jgi:hypothetical protein